MEKSTSKLQTEISEKVSETPFKFVNDYLKSLTYTQLIQLNSLLNNFKLVKNQRERYADPLGLTKVRDFISKAIRENREKLENKEAKRAKFLRGFKSRCN